MRDAITVCLLLALIAIGFTVGHRWKTAAVEATHARVLRLTLEAQRRQTAALAAQAIDTALAFEQAAERMDAIAAQLEQDREANRHHFRAQTAELAALLTRRPDLRGIDLGPDVLQHWNRSNAGPGAATTAPAAGPAGEPADAVSAAAAGDERAGARPAGQPRPGGVAVPRLHGPQSQPAGGGQGMADDGMGLVLHRGRAIGAVARGAVPA